PDARGEFLAPQRLPLLESLESGVAVAIEIDADAIKMIKTAGDGQIARPVILHAVIFDIAAGRKTAHLVRPGPEQRFEAGAVEGTAFERRFGQDRKLHGGGDRALR